MFDGSTPPRLKSNRKYDRILAYVYWQITKGMDPDNLPDDLPFDLDDVRHAMKLAVDDGAIDKPIKNVPDIKYTYDARRDLPPEIEQAESVGHRTWLQNGKGAYTFRRTKRKNLIDLAEYLGDAPEPEVIPDQTPPFIAGLIGDDEQAMFTRVRNAGLLDQFLGFKAYPIQGHHRTTVSYGQIEIDEVQAGLKGNVGVLVPISGKGGQDKLSWSQALNLNTYATEKPPALGLQVRSLGLWRDQQGTVWIVEFSPETNIDEIEITKVQRFKFLGYGAK